MKAKIADQCKKKRKYQGTSEFWTFINKIVLKGYLGITGFTIVLHMFWV